MHNKNNNNQSSVKLVLNTLKYFYAIVLKYKPEYFVLYVFDIMLNAGQPFINIVMPKYIVDELLNGKNIKKIVFYVAVTVLGNVVCNVLKDIVRGTKEKYGDDFDRYFAIRISRKTMKMDFEHTENKEILNQSEKAKTGMQWYSGGVNGITECFSNVVSSIITLLGVIYILAAGSPLLLLIIIASVSFNAVFNAKRNSIQVKAFKNLSALNRAFGYVYWQLSDFRYGKDIRLYSADKMMLEKAESFNNESSGEWKKQAQDSLKYDEGDAILGGVRDGLTYFYLGFLAIKKIITVGNFIMLANAGSTLASSLQSLISSIQGIYQKCNYAYEYVKFMNYPSRLIDGSKKLKKQAHHTIEFRKVSFKYPASDTYILRNVSIKINSGEHLSVVGLNGAGKTTFIKLLCRLYQVNEGEILLDGININEYDYDEYIKMFSVVFQDFRLLAFTIKENIALDRADKVSNEEINELIELVGLKDKMSKLEKGLETPIFKQFEEDGIEPSGGEQQKLAIARALYKNSPVIILDEPTAALDPIAEYEIYRQFDKLVGGKTAVYISHRLSSCKFCDKIAVFSKNAIAEYGTHNELIGIPNGIYAEMFNAQAQYYVE